MFKIIGVGVCAGHLPVHAPEAWHAVAWPLMHSLTAVGENTPAALAARLRLAARTPQAVLTHGLRWPLATAQRCACISCHAMRAHWLRLSVWLACKAYIFLCVVCVCRQRSCCLHHSMVGPLAGRTARSKACNQVIVPHRPPQPACASDGPWSARGSRAGYSQDSWG